MRVVNWSTSLLIGTMAFTWACQSEPVHQEKHAHDTHRADGFKANPNFQPKTPSIGQTRQGLSLEGQVMVIPGDARMVSSTGPGEFGITEDNQKAIVQEVLANYPDEFDTLVVFTTFEDKAQMTEAYSRVLQNKVAGIGLAEENRREDWGIAKDGRLSGFVNMNSLLKWGSGSFTGLNEVGGTFHARMAEQLARRWSHYLRLRRDGMGSDPLAEALLRPMAPGQWSTLAQGDGSVLGANLWERTERPGADGFGKYINRGTDKGFSPLDLYAMGRLSASQVPVFYLLDEAKLAADDTPVDGATVIPEGTEVAGKPVIISVRDVIRAMGSRKPAPEFEEPYYRLAFVLVTAPGEDKSAWEPHLQALQGIRTEFPKSWENWKAGVLCTLVSERCPEPDLTLGGYTIEDADGLIGPGETIGLKLSVLNNGLGTAAGAKVKAEAISATLQIQNPELTIPNVPEGQAVELTDSFQMTISSTITCGTAVRMRFTFISKEGPEFTSELSLPVGTNSLKYDPLNEAVDWKVDPDGMDTASKGEWELGVPEPVALGEIVTQPDTDATPGAGKLAFFTGIEAGNFFASGNLDDGFTTLQSPVFALGGANDPLLVFYVWRSVMDFSMGDPREVPGAPMTIQASNDGGTTWKELAKFEEQTKSWTRVSLRIRDAVIPTDRMIFRFIADDDVGANVEMGIDDLEVIDFLDSCIKDDPNKPDPGKPDPGKPDPGDGGCRCAKPQNSNPSLLMLCLGLGLLSWGRRRR